MRKPLAIDLFCGLGGWTEGLLAEGWDVIGFDIEQHAYGDHRYPAQLVVQDVLTLHGSQFRSADLIVASPPCQEYSYMAMPWKRAKAKAAAIRADETGEKLAALNRLFEACFRIQKEASFAAGHIVPLVVENVRGAIPWVGRSRWSFGSFQLWGDVPALMPIISRGAARLKTGVGEQWNITRNNFTGSAPWSGAHRDEFGVKCAGLDWSAHAEPDYRTSGKSGCFRDTAIKNNGGSWFAIGSPGQKVTGQNPDGRSVHRRDGHAHTKHLTNPQEHAAVATDLGTKIGGDWFSDPQSTCRKHSSKSSGRKMASAMIAKIPLPLSRHIGAMFRPKSGG